MNSLTTKIRILYRSFLILLIIGGLFVLRLFMGWNYGMGEARSEIHATTLDGKLYVAGGIGLFRVLDSCEALDLALNVWSDCGELPRALHHVAMAADDSHVYASGGYVALPFEADKEAGLFRHDPETSSWTEISKLPHPIGQHAMVHFNGSLYLIGGQDDGKDLDTMWRYGIAADKWSAMKPLPTARHSHATPPSRRRRPSNSRYESGCRSHWVKASQSCGRCSTPARRRRLARWRRWRD